MKIDYAMIIAQANARKDALLQFETATKNLKYHVEHTMPDFEAALREFQAAHKALDDEALALLPKDAAHPVNYWASCTAIQIAYYLKGSPGICKMSADEGLTLLVSE